MISINQSAQLFKKGLGVFLFVSLTSFSSAHPLPSELGLVQGFEHPWSGVDHLLAMIAVGLWAMQLGGNALWRVPLSFVLTMLLGGFLGMSGHPLPFVEQGILASFFILGIFVTLSLQVRSLVAAFMVSCFALFHGVAHGTEMPVNSSGLFYAAGFILGTSLLHALGIGLGWGIQTFFSKPLIRYAGALIVILGFYLSYFS